MIREEFIKREVGAQTDFRWRGKEVSRLEGFTDAVFAFVITLLVISTDVPKTFSDLTLAFSLSNVGSFAICFLFLALLWRSHYIFFRRYGLEDGLVFFLNSVYLLIISLYIYPLKFLFTWLLNGSQMASPNTVLTAQAPIYADQAPILMIIYGVGLVCLYLTLTGLYMRAYHQRTKLELNVWETHDTITTIGTNLISIGVGLVSILFAVMVGRIGSILAGLTYLLLWPSIMLYRRYRNRQRQHLTIDPKPPTSP